MVTDQTKYSLFLVKDIIHSLSLPLVPWARRAEYNRGMLPAKVNRSGCNNIWLTGIGSQVDSLIRIKFLPCHVEQVWVFSRSSRPSTTTSTMNSVWCLNVSQCYSLRTGFVTHRRW